MNDVKRQGWSCLDPLSNPVLCASSAAQSVGLWTGGLTGTVSVAPTGTAPVEASNTIAVPATTSFDTKPAVYTMGSTTLTQNLASTTSIVQTSAPASLPAVSPAAGGSDGVSKGAVVGIAIGTTILGALVALMVAFLLFRNRRDRAQPTLKSYDSTPTFTDLSKRASSPYVRVSQIVPSSVAAAATSHARSNSASDLVSFLPAVAEDHVVSQKMAALFEQIRAHVDKFYRNVHATVTPSMEGNLAVFGNGDFSMVELLQSSSQPTSAVKHALTGYILSITAEDGESDTTLFPSQVVGIGKGELATGSQAQAYTLYKRLAAHLYSPTPSAAQVKKSDMREAAEHFALAFFPWASPESDDLEKDEDLVSILSNALDTIVWLYGQPAEYGFTWNAGMRRGIVVSPSVLKVADGQSRVLLESIVVAA